MDARRSSPLWLDKMNFNRAVKEKMKKKITSLFSLLIILIPFLTLGIRTISAETNDRTASVNSDQMYRSLLNMFPLDKQGYSLEPSKPAGPFEQPMTYGLILSSESIHYRGCPNLESKERVKNAIKWIIGHSDEDKDGNAGWGLPQAWDAFSDGTINPENHPYSITTSIVIEGLLDSLTIDNFWTKNEEKEIKELIREVTLFWLDNIYIGDENLGYIGYSPEKTDMQNCPNISGMFLSHLVKTITRHGDIFNESDREFVIQRMHAIANMLINEVNLEEGLPYWQYIEYEKTDISPNDLIHHIYTLWGIEEYRAHFNNIEIPFTLDNSLASVNKFIKDDRIYAYPQNKIYTGEQEHYNNRPARLWGIGMMLGFYSKYDNENMADKVLETIANQYGDWPNLTRWPSYFSNDSAFYGRFAAHVLFGLSYKNFY